jgi:hypothetical protein
LLVWDKDSYTERSLALLPCTCVLQSTLVHLLPGPLPTVASASLYSLLYSEHINDIQVLDFLPFPYSSCDCSPLIVWPPVQKYYCTFRSIIHIWGRTCNFWPSAPG